MIDSIIKWANSELLFAWQREAVKRLLTQGSLTLEDKEQLYEFFKKEFHLIAVGENQVIVEPIKKEKIVGIPNSPKKIILKAIQDIKNVNVISDGSKLPFAHKELTVIYGENGTGKSGYARILKKACFARDVAEKIYSNIFNAISYPAEATFKLGIDGQDEYFKWTDGKQKPEILGNICVFDSKSARVITDEKNEVSYLPYGADVFYKLSDIMQDFKGRLEREKPILCKPEISDLPTSTQAGAFLNSLDTQTKNEDLIKWFEWTVEQENSLTKLSSQYFQAKSGDTTNRILTLENLKKRIDSFKGKLVECSNLLSSVSIENINNLINSRKMYIKAFEQTSKMPEGPLGGITTNEWQVLYWAAKDYSVKQAYRGEKFPVIDADKKCVLCMQTLSEDAKARLKKFSEYMENSVKTSLDVANRNLTNLIESLKARDLEKVVLDYKDVLDAIEIIDKNTALNITEHFFKLMNIKIALIEAEKSGNLCQENGHDFELNNIEKTYTAIDAKIEECKKHSNPEELAKLQTEIAELKAKKQFAENKELIKDYFIALNKLFKFNMAISCLDTKSITDKGKDLVGKALTPQLKAALLEELNFLNVKHIPLDLQHFGSLGKNVYQVKIEGQKTANIKLTEILSEGEQKVIAIAGFLAELSLQKNSAPIVLDDPVSSLDHEYSEKIAERLVKESSVRQVIVFTHDISFLLDLDEKSEEKDLDCHCISVHRTSDAAGIIRSNKAWHVMKVNERLNYIQSELQNIISLYQSDKTKYNNEAATLYGLLRETWEAAIEECLLNNAIKRFSSKIKTLSLKEVTFEKKDYDTINEGMTKCSKWMFGHDLSKQISDNRPSPVDFQQDIKSLKDFVDSTGTRRKAYKAIKTQRPDIG